MFFKGQNCSLCVLIELNNLSLFDLVHKVDFDLHPQLDPDRDLE